MICWMVAEIWAYSIVDQLVALTALNYFERFPTFYIICNPWPISDRNWDILKLNRTKLFRTFSDILHVFILLHLIYYTIPQHCRVQNPLVPLRVGGGCWSRFRGIFFKEFWVVDISMQINDQTIHTYMTCFQNQSISMQKTRLLVWCLHCLYRYSKTSNAFSPLYIFELKVVFRYHFLGHFFDRIEWNLLWIIIE